eukprot:1143175-Pelagomonas_calceolata.AAC.2
MAQTPDAPTFDVPPAPWDPADESITSEDIGNVVSFEHVPDLEIARLFFCEGLGREVKLVQGSSHKQLRKHVQAFAFLFLARLTLDPSRIGAQRGGMNVLWMNVGKQQFAIAVPNSVWNATANIVGSG